MPEFLRLSSSRVASWLIPLVAAAVVVATVGLVTVHRQQPADQEQAGDALVVSANLQDAIRSDDAADTRDLDTFVRRLTAATPQAPDVLLLTEVLGPGAERVATSLSDATGDRYSAVLAPGKSAFLPDGAVRESAIVVNTSTTNVVDQGRFVRVQGEDQAYTVVAKNGSDLRIPVISAHTAGDPLRAVQQLHAAVSADGGGEGNQVPVLGGDYRAGRCVDSRPFQPVDCAAQNFWTTLTTTFGYEDAFFAHSGAETQKNPTYVFAHGTVKDAFVDTAYARDLPDPAACKSLFDAGRSSSASQRCRSTYYADAPFGWAVVTAGESVQRSVAPQQVTLDHCELGVRGSAALARLVNNTGEDITEEVAAQTADPLDVSPSSDTLTVPAGQARWLPLKITAPQNAGVTSGEVTVTVGQLTTTVAVSLPADCTEAAAVATSFHSGTPPENAVDGDITTIWHSEFSPPTPLPQSITVNLKEEKTVSQLTYQPRFDGNLNGTIREFNVYVSTDGQDFTQVASGTWPVDARLKTATFSAVPARYVRLEATAASGGSFASAAEVDAS